jgi:hypothetical protein
MARAPTYQKLVVRVHYLYEQKSHMSPLTLCNYYKLMKIIFKIMMVSKSMY